MVLATTTMITTGMPPGEHGQEEEQTAIVKTRPPLPPFPAPISAIPFQPRSAARSAVKTRARQGVQRRQSFFSPLARARYDF